MIFIVGPGHSGTSVLTAILDTHSELQAVPGETYACFNGGLEDLMEQYGDGWVEKTPMHLHFLDYILQYPENKAIIMWRNREDVVKSRIFRGAAEEDAQGLYDLSIRSAEKWGDHDRCYRMNYEDLMADFEGETGRLLEFLDLPYEDLSGFYQVERNWYRGNPHAERRNQQLHQPIGDFQ